MTVHAAVYFVVLVHYVCYLVLVYTYCCYVISCCSYTLWQLSCCSCTVNNGTIRNVCYHVVLVQHKVIVHVVFV